MMQVLDWNGKTAVIEAELDVEHTDALAQCWTSDGMGETSTDGMEVTIILNANGAIDIGLGRASPYLGDEGILDERRAMGVGPVFTIVVCPGVGVQDPELGEE
jgi:hypothetical protein